MVSGRCHKVSGMCEIVSGMCQMMSGRCLMVSERCQILLDKCWMVLERCQKVLGSAQSIFYKTPPAPSVYFIRLLPRPEYILKDSWQEAYVKHMEIKDLHVAIVLSPICGPNVIMPEEIVFFLEIYFTQLAMHLLQCGFLHK